jgi:predicted anti-sigma-YlaC factor YlaD
MNCKNCRTDLIGYIRGTLQPDLGVRIREHLDGCMECRSFADYLATTLDVIRMEREMTPDPFLATRIEGILSGHTHARPGLSLVTRLIPALTFSIFVLAGIGGGFTLGKMISPKAAEGQIAKDELTILIDELQQEPMEAFFMSLNDMAEN